MYLQDKPQHNTKRPLSSREGDMCEEECTSTSEQLHGLVFSCQDIPVVHGWGILGPASTQDARPHDEHHDRDGEEEEAEPCSTLWRTVLG